ncbi:MAG TPA: class E sortase [Solirubrobacterales bacterium]|nr:class E sortase [Solirubrobacterales bacterium]
MRPGGGWIRAVLRFVASVLIVSGVLMLADAGLTVAWQEPVSAFMAARDQGELEDELEAQAASTAADKRLTASIRDVRRRIKRLAELDRKRAEDGHALGRIEFPTLDREYVFVEGTDLDVLRKGPGHYPKTSFPGEGGTVAIAGHRTTYGAPFRTIDDLEPGEHIVVKMPYAELEYKVEKTQIVNPDATWITNRVKGPERLVLSACHPLYSASQRVIVFARLVQARVT